MVSNRKSPSYTKIAHQVAKLKKHILAEKTNSDPLKNSEQLKNGDKFKMSGGKVVFDQREKIDLLRGLNAAKGLSNHFSLTQTCPHFGFADGKYSGGKIKKNGTSKRFI